MLLFLIGGWIHTEFGRLLFCQHVTMQYQGMRRMHGGVAQLGERNVEVVGSIPVITKFECFAMTILMADAKAP